MLNARDIRDLKVIYEAFMATKPTRKEVDVVLTVSARKRGSDKENGHSSKRR